MSEPAALPATPVRIGIDVGGTFTKGVALDAADRSLLAQARVPTTHRASEGVVAGVLEVLEVLLQELPEGSEVTLVAHATTQATNALLEGDMARVGILALGPRAEEAMIRKVTRLADIRLSPSRQLRPLWAFVPTDTDEDALEAAVAAQLERWKADGVEVVAVNQAFGVDDPSLERRVAQWATRSGLPATAGSDLTGVYGLELRSSTSAVNASILPTMLRTARHVEAALARTLPGVPLLVVRGDGGAASLQGLSETPIQTIVSGPAASLAGAIMRQGVTDGIFFEVGGTSTNIGAIKGGRPVMKAMTVMDFPTALRAADIRIAGVAGGSLIRLGGRRIEAVGPRSAHIAGLSYACFAPAEALAGAKLVRMAPKAGDSEDYAVLEAPDGRRYAITPTCAANALAAMPEQDAARAEPESARLALGLLAEALGADAQRTARAVLEASAEKLVGTVSDIARAYRLQGGKLYGGGGAAAVLGPVVAARLGMEYVCVPDAAAISSIGAALTLIRVERDQSVTINDPTIAELLTREVEREAVRLGADPSRLQTEVRYQPEERLLRAVAVGAHPVDSLHDTLSDEVLRSLARGLIGPSAETVYSGEGQAAFLADARVRRLFRKVHRHPLIVLDRRGARLLVLEDAEVLRGEPGAVLSQLRGKLSGSLAPRIFALTPRRLIDCSHLTGADALLAFLEKTFRLESEVALVVTS